MNFEELIPVIAVIIYFIVSILKRGAKKGKTAKPAKTAEKKGLSLKLHNILQEVKEEMERAAEAEKADKPGDADFWEQELELQDEDIRDTRQEQEEIDLPGPDYIRIPTKKEKPSKSTLVKAIDRKPAKQPEPETGPAPSRKRYRKFTRARLRDAVVMSEIIATPVSLRDQ